MKSPAEQFLQRPFAVVLLLFGTAGCWNDSPPVVEQQQTPPANSSQETMQGLLQQGQYQQALQAARNTLVASPDNVDALRVVSQANAALQRYSEAAESAVAMANLAIEDPIAELVQAFDWHLRAGDFASAEHDLRLAREVDTNDPRPLRTLAQLLNSQGRRHEASSLVQELVRRQQASSRELISLIDMAGPFDLVSFGELTKANAPNLFDFGKARHLYVTNGKIPDARATIKRLRVAYPKQTAIAAFEGRMFAQMNDFTALEVWRKNLPAGIEAEPEYWSAIGAWLSNQQRDREAARAFAKALRSDPTDRFSLRSLSQTLESLGEQEAAAQARETLATLDKLFRIGSFADAEQAFWISEQLQKLARPWEAIAWYRHGLQMQGNANARGEELAAWEKKIKQWESQGNSNQIRDARLSKMVAIDLNDFPIPDLQVLKTLQTQDPEPLSNSQRENLRLRDVAPELGVQTSFISDYDLDVPNFYLYQANGGGIGVIDYDLDGRSDLYFSQSGGNPEEQDSSTPNELYRQLPDGEFVDCSIPSQTVDRGFGQGVCVGDINQDGFPDLLVANIGKNSLWLNQGDGSFRSSIDTGIEAAGAWTSSIATGDLNGDGLPEVVEVNYLNDPAIFQRPCEGAKLDCTPQRFRAASDVIYENLGDGSFAAASFAGSISELPNFGFGLVISNFDRKYGNDIFISNDGDLNHYWLSQPAENQEGFLLTEAAGSAGCTIGTNGISQACMGIASGDFDQNGYLDLTVTNFHDEPVNLFLQNQGGFFEDKAAKYGLAELSMKMLGFGSQAADFDNDGWLDLAVLNGHIYDARYAGIPFRMTPQLLRGGPRGFSLQDPEAAGDYWQREQLGRTLAVVDVDRDGKMDLVANHLDQPISILRNETDSGNFLQLELVGVASERDAIGTRVTVHAGDRSWTGWQIGGDGYMCSNESVIHFGVGSAAHIDRIELEWPSGSRQQLTALSANHRYVVIEGQSPEQR